MTSSRWVRHGVRLAVFAAVLFWVLPPGDPYRLVSVDPLPPTDGTACEWSPHAGAVAYAQALKRVSNTVDPTPIRVIHDDVATFSAVAVDAVRNEIILQDENLYEIRVYDRTANTPPNVPMTEPRRIISGPKTDVEFNCGLYVDQATGEIYSVNNDTTDKTVIFGTAAKGDVAPDRALHTPHGTYGIAVDEVNKEMLFTIEHDNAVVTYPKFAKDEEPPIRLIQGDHTGLADPHGIAVDPARNLIFVANHGSTHKVAGKPQAPNWPLTRSFAVPGSGQLWPPSITVYERTAVGDARPVRTIQGPLTRLNWPAQLSYDAARDELFVANDGDSSVLVFRGSDSGNAAPVRAIKGPKTTLSNPTGVWVDVKNDEVVVSNMGNHSATVFARTATGDVAPLRTIRAAPLGKKALAIGNPGAIGYDSKRDELLVPN